jgi:hypothetical protein
MQAQINAWQHIPKNTPPMTSHGHGDVHQMNQNQKPWWLLVLSNVGECWVTKPKVLVCLALLQCMTQLTHPWVLVSPNQEQPLLLGHVCIAKAVRTILLVAMQKFALVTMPHVMMWLCMSKLRLTPSVTYQSSMRVFRIAKCKSPPWLQSHALMHSGMTPCQPVHHSVTYHSHKAMYSALGTTTRQP